MAWTDPGFPAHQDGAGVGATTAKGQCGIGQPHFKAGLLGTVL